MTNPLQRPWTITLATLALCSLSPACGSDNAPTDTAPSDTTATADTTATPDTPTAQDSAPSPTDSAPSPTDSAAAVDGLAADADPALADGSSEDAGLAPCASDADCAGLDNPDLCKGTLFCDKTANPPACVNDPKTVISCPATDEACHGNACDPKTGKCELTEHKNGSLCEGKWPACWSNTTCLDGVCQGGTPLCKCHPDWESDDDPATPKCDTWANNGNQCLGKLGCVTPSSGPAGMYACQLVADSVVQCDKSKDDQCNINTCDPDSGKCAVKVLQGNLCDDGNKCTNGEKCTDGACKIVNFKQQFVCKCSPDYLVNCVNELGDAPCDGTLFCDVSGGQAKCALKDPVKCDASNDTNCAMNLCDNKLGTCAVTPSKEGALCDDGDKCTPNDFCKAGKCTAGTPNVYN